MHKKKIDVEEEKKAEDENQIIESNRDERVNLNDLNDDQDLDIDAL